MTQHSQNGEGVEAVRAVTAEMRRFMPNACGDWADKIDAALAAPQPLTAAESGELAGYIHGKDYRDNTVEAVEQRQQRFNDLLRRDARYRQSLTAREPATADVGREGIALSIRTHCQCAHRNSFDAADEILTALSRAAPSSGHEMAEGEDIGRFYALPFSFHEPEGDGAAYIRDANGQSVAMMMWPGHTAEQTDAAVAETYAIGRAFASLATTPPTTNDAIPAGMVRWDGGDRAPEDWDSERPIAVEEQGKVSIRHGWRWNWSREPMTAYGHKLLRIIAYTPKPSPTPKGGLPGRGEDDDMAWLSTQRRLSLSFYSPMYGDDDDQSEEWRVHKESGPINDREWDIVGRGATVADAVRAARDALAPAEAIRDGGEGGETA